MSKMKSRVSKLVSMLCVVSMLVSALPVSVFAADEGEHDHGTEEYIYVNGEYILNPDVAPKPETATFQAMTFQAAALSGSTIYKEGGWLESAYIEWTIDSNVSRYEVDVKAKNATGWTKLDNELVREYPGYMRADALGLKAGTYQMRVRPNGSETGALVSGDLTVLAHDRSGWAFEAGKAPGAYNMDGTLKTGAKVVYITNQNKDTVTVNLDLEGKGETPVTGLQNLVLAYKKGAKSKVPPMAIRLIGNIDVPSNNLKGDIQSDTNKYPCYLTVEGVGNDAVANGWGFTMKNTSYLELRNLAFMNCHSDEGDNIGLQQTDDHIWVHNCDSFYGDAGSDADQVKGDGALDTKKSLYITHSYNHFWDNGKCNLQGANASDTSNYITYHHNWYDHSDSRHPRVRRATVHVYNNYYDGNAKYGVGSTTDSDVFVENNYFRNCKDPMMISMQGTDAKGGGTFSGEDGGMIKAYGNTIVGAASFIPYTNGSTDFDAYVAGSRDEQVPSSVKATKGGAGYNNFDTDTSNYVGKKDYLLDSPAEAREKVMKYAGRVEGGDFKWTFNNAIEDTNYNVIPALKSAVTDYETTLISVGGLVTQSSGGAHTEHTYGPYTVKTAATCTANGVEERTCLFPGCGHTDTREIPGGHKYVNGECSVCHEREPEGGGDPGPSGGTVNKVLRASDFKMTPLDASTRKHSSFVEGELAKVTDYFTMFGTVLKRTKDTTSEGSTAEYFDLSKSSNNGFTFTVKAENAPATLTARFSSTGSSNTSALVLEDSTGTKMAVKGGTATYTTVTGTAKQAKEATYELQAGTYTIKGSTDGNAASDARLYSATVAETTSETEHQWGGWQVVRAATCGKDGLEERVCSKCGTKDPRTIPATGEHTWGDWKDVGDGMEERECSDCGETESKTGEPPTPSVTVSKVELNKTTLTLEVSKNEKLTATVTVTPDDAANKTVTWKSSNAAVATVNSDGTVIAKAVGTATITATSDKDSSKTASCAVTVKAKTADKSGLTDIIAKANAAVDGVAENTDAANVPVGTSWALKADIDAFKAAIAKAQAVADKADATAEDVSEAVTELNAAITAFANKLKDGTKPNGGGSTPAKIFESKNLTAFSSGKSDGDTEQAGTDNYFTIIYSSSSKVDNSSKSWGDGYESGQRLNLGGKLDPSKNAVKFTTGGAATVKVWFVQGGDDNRQMGIITENKTAVATSNVEGMTKGNPYYAELSISAAGTYFLGGKEGNNYIFKIEVVETASGSDDPTPVDKSALTAAIATAEADLAAAIESVDGSEVESDKKWVSKEDKELFAAEIALAKLSAKTAKTDAEVTAAINALKAASDAFEAAAQSGVKDEGGDTPIIPDDPGSGGGGGGGGGFSSSASKTDKIVDTTITVDGTVKDNVAVAEVTAAQAKTLTGNAVKNNSENIVVVIDAEADTARLNVSANALKNMSSRTDAALNVQTGLGTVKLPAAAVADLGSNSGKSVSVIVAKTDGGMKITVGVGNKIQDQVSGGVTAIVDANGAGSVAYLLAADGSERLVKKSYVDADKLHANIPGSGTIILKDNAKDFRDTADSWAKEAIDFATSRELFNGVNELDFAPNQTMTRSMLVTVLYRLEGAKSGAANKFADVNADSWYAEAVAWANAEGIVSGKSETHFGPNDDITREQLATILYRYATGLCGMDEVSKDSKALEKFSDKAVVSGFAADGMAWAVEQGVIGGRSDGTLAPGGFASRAEVATMLMRFVKAII